MNLKSAQHLVNGTWHTAGTAKDVSDPGNGSTVGEVAWGTGKDATKAADAAVAAAQPALCLLPHLPAPPKGRTIVIGAGKASAAMAQALEQNWQGKLEGVVVAGRGGRAEVPVVAETGTEDRIGSRVGPREHEALIVEGGD